MKISVNIDQNMVLRFSLLKPVDGYGKPISLEKYVNDLLADSVAAAEELDSKKSSKIHFNFK